MDFGNGRVPGTSTVLKASFPSLPEISPVDGRPTFPKAKSSLFSLAPSAAPAASLNPAGLGVGGEVEEDQGVRVKMEHWFLTHPSWDK